MKLAKEKHTSHMFNFRVYMDEAGRGPLAGPVFVGGILSRGSLPNIGAKDSKLLSEKKRESLYKEILDLQNKQMLVGATGYTSAKDIDTRGIISSLTNAAYQTIFRLFTQFYKTQGREMLLTSVFGEDLLACQRLDTVCSKKPSKKTLIEILTVDQSIWRRDSIIIDGNHTFNIDNYLPVPVHTIIKGDQKIPAISLASILAKVERDRLMKKLDRYIPEYRIEQHKGYGTKLHRKQIQKYGCSLFHRKTFCSNITNKKNTSGPSRSPINFLYKNTSSTWKASPRFPLESIERPKLLLHICCAPDLTWPLHRLKNHFHLCLFRYNPNIHPRKEHSKRYEQFLKLIGLEEGSYSILEDWYDPKEFFDAMVQQKETIHPDLQDADKKTVLQTAGEMEERSDRCNPCYSMRLSQAAKTAAEHNIPYFTSTLLISPKKHMEKLFMWGVDAEKTYPDTKFLRFNFAKNQGYQKAVELTRKHQLRRQNYCGCGWTINKKNEGYSGG